MCQSSVRSPSAGPGTESRGVASAAPPVAAGACRDPPICVRRARPLLAEVVRQDRAGHRCSAAAEPPPCSTRTASAMRGSSAGAKATNQPWGRMLGSLGERSRRRLRHDLGRARLSADLDLLQARPPAGAFRHHQPQALLHEASVSRRDAQWLRGRGRRGARLRGLHQVGGDQVPPRWRSPPRPSPSGSASR